jgi:hypothetical protein
VNERKNGMIWDRGTRNNDLENEKRKNGSFGLLGTEEQKLSIHSRAFGLFKVIRMTQHPTCQVISGIWQN